MALTPLLLATAGALVATVGLEGALWISGLLGSAASLGLLDPQIRSLRRGRYDDAPSDLPSTA